MAPFLDLRIMSLFQCQQRPLASCCNKTPATLTHHLMVDDDSSQSMAPDLADSITGARAVPVYLATNWGLPTVGAEDVRASKDSTKTNECAVATASTTVVEMD
jgi:hypothetical protein